MKKSNCLNGLKPSMFHAANSSSHSDIWQFSSILNEELFCKVFNVSSPGLTYEAKVYEYISNHFSKHRNDPYHKCFVDLYCFQKNLSYYDIVSVVVGSFGIARQQVLRNLTIMQCGNPRARPALTSKVPLTHDPKTIPLCYKYKQNNLNSIVRSQIYSIIVTKRPPGDICTLHDFIRNRNISRDVKRDVLGKTVLVMRKMHSLHISHNDLLWTNILVSNTDTTLASREYKDTVTSNIFSFRSEYVPVVFDWDRSQLKDDYSNIGTDDYDTLYKPKYATHRDILLLFKNIFRYSPYIFEDDDDQFADVVFDFFFVAMSSADKEHVFSIMNAHNWAFAEESNLAWLYQYLEFDAIELLEYFQIQRTYPPDTVNNYIHHMWCKETFKSEAYVPNAAKILNDMGVVGTEKLDKHQLCAQIQERSRSIIDDGDPTQIKVQEGPHRVEVWDIYELVYEIEHDPIFKATFSDAQQRRIQRVLIRTKHNNVQLPCNALDKNRNSCEARKKCAYYYQQSYWWDLLMKPTPEQKSLNGRCKLAVSYVNHMSDHVHDVVFDDLLSLMIEIYATNVEITLLKYKDVPLFQQQEQADIAWENFSLLSRKLYNMNDTRDVRAYMQHTIDLYLIQSKKL